MAGHAIKVWGLTPEVGLLAGTATGAVLGWSFGVLAIRRQGIYFAMITLALAQMVFFVRLQAKFTGGEDGLQGVPRGKLFGVIDLANDLTMYYVALVVMVAAFLLIVRTMHSPFGQVLKGIKENEPRALSLGYDVSRFKLLAFVISAALSGLAGSLKTLVLGFATLSDVHWTQSGQVDPDDAGRRPGHVVRAAGRLGGRGAAREQDRRYRHLLARDHEHRLVQHAGRVGDDGHGADLRRSACWRSGAASWARSSRACGLCRARYNLRRSESTVTFVKDVYQLADKPSPFKGAFMHH